MARGIPHNALLHNDNSHLHCEICRDPLHPPLMQDVIQLSIDEVRNQITQGTQMWAGARGEENFRRDNPNLGDKPLQEMRVREIEPMYQQALKEVREGLSQYPIEGGVNLRHEDGSHIMEHIYRNETGRDVVGKGAIGQFIRDNDIKGHTVSSPDGLSGPSKMPGSSEDTPTWACPIGSNLRGDANSVCSGCYVDSILHTKHDSVQHHQARNLLGLAKPHRYAAALSYQMGQSPGDLVRLNSSGDNQGPHHFAIHSDVARAHPDKRFWLSTREQNHLEDWLNAGGQIPPNLTIRVSQHKQHTPVHGLSDNKQSKKVSALMTMHPNIVGSSVNASHLYDDNVWVCPAAGKKGDEGTCEYHGCDACWDPTIPAIDYTGHGSKNMHHSLDEMEGMFAETKRRWTEAQLKTKQAPVSEGFDLSQFGL